MTLNRCSVQIRCIFAPVTEPRSESDAKRLTASHSCDARVIRLKCPAWSGLKLPAMIPIFIPILYDPQSLLYNIRYLDHTLLQDNRLDRMSRRRRVPGSACREGQISPL